MKQKREGKNPVFLASDIDLKNAEAWDVAHAKKWSD